jgi:hypothetical protein
MDIYRDYFTREQLLLSLSNVQFQSGQVGALGVFETVGLTGTTFGIEVMPDNDVAEMTGRPRGAPALPVLLEKRKVETFTITEGYPISGVVLADEVLNVRTSGTMGGAEVITTRRDELVAKMQRKMEWQHEYLRVACLNSPTNVLGTAPASAAVAFGAADSAIRTAIHNNVIKAMESALGGLSYNRLIALCDDTFWVGFIESKTIRETYLNQAQAAELRQAIPDSVDYAGITWVRHRASGNIALTSGKAKVIPLGVPDLFKQFFAPNDTLSSVGQGALGQPYYLTSKVLDDDKGFQITMDSYPKMLCTRPQAVLTLGLS